MSARPSQISSIVYSVHRSEIHAAIVTQTVRSIQPTRVLSPHAPYGRHWSGGLLIVHPLPRAAAGRAPCHRQPVKLLTVGSSVIHHLFCFFFSIEFLLLDRNNRCSRNVATLHRSWPKCEVKGMGKLELGSIERSRVRARMLSPSLRFRLDRVGVSPPPPPRCVRLCTCHQ